MGKQFLLDPYLDHGLKAADRSFFYSEVVVGFHAGKSFASADDADSVINKSMAASASLPTNRLDGWMSGALRDSVRAEPLTADNRHLLRPSPFWLTGADLASLPSFDVAVGHVTHGYDFVNHPYISWMMAPGTTREQFRSTQLPFQFAVERFSQPLAAVVSKIDRTPLRFNVCVSSCSLGRVFVSVCACVYVFFERMRCL